MFVIDEPNETLFMKDEDTNIEFPEEEIRIGALSKYPYAQRQPLLCVVEWGSPPAFVAQDHDPEDVIFATNK